MKKAFTMLELIFVIIVMGILAAVIEPNTRRNLLQEAAVQITSHIRYTQHLAMVDDQYNASNNNWFKARWQIFFQLDNYGYKHQVYGIYRDIDRDDDLPENGEIAIDTLSGSQMTGNSVFRNREENMDLTHKYGIINRSFSGGCAGAQRIMFDHLGRPYTDDKTIYGNLIYTPCNITFSNENDEKVVIRVHPETGYVCILNDAGSDCR
jgi:prepilin-type N-terminal cleavage/methylation domain-containing protein